MAKVFSEWLKRSVSLESYNLNLSSRLWVCSLCRSQASPELELNEETGWVRTAELGSQVDRIRTDLEVILALFFKLKLLKSPGSIYSLPQSMPHRQRYPTEQKASVHLHLAGSTDDAQGIGACHILVTELHQDASHIFDFRWSILFLPPKGIYGHLKHTNEHQSVILNTSRLQKSAYGHRQSN